MKIDVIPLRATLLEGNRITLENGEMIDYHLLVWASGANPPQFLAQTELDLTEEGFIKVKKTLQTIKYPYIFAAGDCCSIEGCDYVAKAGVYAVREGPPLAKNIIALLKDQKLHEYDPQRFYLALLMTGDGQAISNWYKTSFQGQLVWKLKDKIDTKFMHSFQVLCPIHKSYLNQTQDQ